MAIEHRHTGACSGDLEILLFCESCRGRIEATKNLLRFYFQFLFFAGDIWNDVIDDVHAADARVSCSANSLQSDDGALRDGAEASLKCGEWDDQPNDGAVGVTDLVAAGFVSPLGLLVRDEGQMSQVDGRDDQGDERILAVVLGVGEDGDAMLRKSLLCNVFSLRIFF